MQAREEQAADTLFGGGKDGNFVSNIFDGAACVVSSVIGGGNPKCHGKGSNVVEPPPPHGDKKPGDGDNNGSDHENTAYNYSYDTNQDGSLKITITLQKGGSCTYNLKPEGTTVQDVVSEAAKKCLAEKN